MYETYETVNKDLPTEHVWVVGTNKLRATRFDPYGFWKFSFERGVLPAELQGEFSSEYRMFNAAKSYLDRKDKKEI